MGQRILRSAACTTETFRSRMFSCAQIEPIYAVSNTSLLIQFKWNDHSALLLKGYMRRQDTNAKAAMESILGITEQDDLYEVAGCMLRLALWPTDAL